MAPVGIKNSWKYEKDLIIFNLNKRKRTIGHIAGIKPDKIAEPSKINIAAWVFF